MADIKYCIYRVKGLIFSSSNINYSLQSKPINICFNCHRNEKVNFTIFLIIIGLLFIHFWFNDTLGQYSVCSGHKFTFCSRARHRHNHVIPLIFSVHLLYLLKQFTSGPVTTLNRLNKRPDFVKPMIRLYRSVLSSLFNWALRSQKLLSIIVTQMKLRGQKTFN